MPKVLVVDDEPHIVKLVGFTLRNHGFEVIDACDGLTGVDLARSERPDLILMDVMMPVIDGHEACRRLKACPETASIPVLMLSAKSQGNEIAAGLDSGAADYVCKPFTPSELLGKVCDLTDVEREA